MTCYSYRSMKTEKGRVNFPCGKCIGCLQRKRSDWTFRLTQENKVAKSSKFVTLTYNEENIVLNDDNEGTLCKVDVQKFMKRLRKKQKQKIRFFAVGEYGTINKRPHYHIILFNQISDDHIHQAWSSYDKKEKKYKLKGKIDIGKVNNASIHYITKYILPRMWEQFQNKEPPYSTMSKRPAIGHNYIDEAKNKHQQRLDNIVMFKGGQKITMPRYYRNKIFSEDQREQISIKTRLIMDDNLKKALKDAKDNNVNYWQKQILKLYAKRHMANKYSKSKNC